jgi:hypothetical protein
MWAPIRRSRRRHVVMAEAILAAADSDPENWLSLRRGR